MKKFLSFALAILSVAAGWAQNIPPALISVSGTGEVKVQPDEVSLSLGVETRHVNLEPATRQNNEQVARALAFLKQSEVPSKDIQTDFLSIEPVYDANVSQTKPVAYVARKSIEAKLANIPAFEGILTGLLANGVNYVHGIDFRTSKLRKHRDTARAMAVQAAREKADDLARQLRVRRGKVFSVNANDWGGGWSSSANWGARYGRAMMQNAVQNSGGEAEAPEGTLSIGQISVSASVNVSFLIE